MEIFVWIGGYVQETVRTRYRRSDVRPTYQRIFRRRWTFHQFRCLSNDVLDLLSSATTEMRERGSRLTPGEVTTLQHELGNDTVETASFVSLSLPAGSKLTEVFGGLGNNIVVELEDNATGGLVADGDIKLVFIGHEKGIVGLGCEKSSRAHSTRYRYVRRR